MPSLVVRDAQLSAFARARFLAWMTRHLETHFPEQCEALGADGVRHTLHTAIAKAHGHGFTREPDVCRFVDLVFTFGLTFDDDERLPWARATLAALKAAGGTPAIEPLHRAAMLYLRDLMLGTDGPPR